LNYGNRPPANDEGDRTVITELAIISIRPGSAEEFEAAFAQAQEILASSGGYESHTLRRSIETPHRYALTVQWRTLEDHTVGFRGSPAFTQWRALIGPYFDVPPVVEHFERPLFARTTQAQGSSTTLPT
jgi:heme-degrading monooxygenase HmoA